MVFYGLNGVAGTAGIVPTMTGHQWTDQVSVTCDKAYQYTAHGWPSSVGFGLIKSGFGAGLLLQLTPQFVEQAV